MNEENVIVKLNDGSTFGIEPRRVSGMLAGSWEFDIKKEGWINNCFDIIKGNKMSTQLLFENLLDITNAILNNNVIYEDKPSYEFRFNYVTDNIEDCTSFTAQPSTLDLNEWVMGNNKSTIDTIERKLDCWIKLPTIEVSFDVIEPNEFIDKAILLIKEFEVR